MKLSINRITVYKHKPKYTSHNMQVKIFIFAFCFLTVRVFDQNINITLKVFYYVKNISNHFLFLYNASFNSNFN